MVEFAYHVQKRLLGKSRWLVDVRPLIADKSLLDPAFDLANFSVGGMNWATQPMETGPAPQRTFNNSQRFAVSTFQSNSGVAKPIRAHRSGFPVFQDWTKFPSDSSGERTSRTTVFVVPPRFVFLKIDHQPTAYCMNQP